MIHYFAIFFLSLLIPLSFTSAFGDIDFITDKSLYHKDDQLNISGSVSYDPLAIPGASILIITPGQSDIAGIGFADVDSDGNFSFNVRVGGIKWLSDGIYSIKVTYNNESKEKSIEYKELSSSTSTPTTPTTPTIQPPPKSPSTPTTQPIPEPTSTFTTLKLQIPNFPSLDNSPQSYIDRYNNEYSYKSWFDSQFPFNSINDVVGYKLTPVDGFPSLDKSPQSYIDRYNNESSYKSWFDSQFSGTSIYNILGYEDPVAMPDLIQSNAELWATGAIPDSTFATGIEFMLENNIIMISNISSGSISGDEIPNWVRNNAHWWSQDLISEDEFVNSLKFLIQEGIIEIN